MLVSPSWVSTVSEVPDRCLNFPLKRCPVSSVT